MKVAVYDNPTSFCREAWQDQRMIAFISADALMEKGFNGHRNLPFMLSSTKPFTPGELVYGDFEAILW